MRQKALLLLFYILIGHITGCAAWPVALPSFPHLAPPARFDVFWREPFDQLERKRWREVEVHGRTHYDTALIDGRRCLKASSNSTASILLSPVRFDPKVYGRISWSWRIEKPVFGESLTKKSGSDAAARLYVYFKTKGLPWQKRSLDYVWSTSLPAGAILNSAYSSSSKIIVAESGSASLGKWLTVSRDINSDYRHSFGGQAPDVVAIGIMSDSDDTKGQGVAYFDDIEISR